MKYILTDDFRLVESDKGFSVKQIVNKIEDLLMDFYLKEWERNKLLMLKKKLLS